jgi:hypothetical protein
MPGQINEGSGDEPPPPPPQQHVEVTTRIDENQQERTDDDEQSSHNLRDSKGWDGKLRIDRTVTVQNPEALSDPEYSDEENVLPGESIGADEGILIYLDFSLYLKRAPTDPRVSFQTSLTTRTPIPTTSALPILVLHRSVPCV